MRNLNRQSVLTLAAFAVVLLLGASSAWACPTCKDGLGHDPATAGLVRGYAISIVFMISMPFLIFTGLSSYFYWEICRARRVAQVTGLEVEPSPAPTGNPKRS